MLSVLACLLACSGALRGELAGWNLPGQAPHLIFHYLPWFATAHSNDNTKPWEHWKWDGPGPSHNPENRLPNGKRDLASVYYPLIGAYGTDDRAVVRYHMQTIKAAGGEAVAIDWYGPDMSYDARTPIIVEEAARAGLKVTLCYEEKMNFVWPDFRNPKTRVEAVDAAVKDFRYILSRYASSPAFLRRDGLPYLFLFNGWGDGKLGPQYFTPGEYQQIMSRLPEKIVFGRQGLEPAYDSTTKARFLWWSADGKAIRYFGKEARNQIDSGRLSMFMSFISPGFNDSGVSGWGGKARVVPRAGLSLLKGTFDNAFGGDPELVQVVTWNDFNEGTAVEPTTENGFQYLDAIATWWSQRKGCQADLKAIRQPYLDYIAHANALERAELPRGSVNAFLAKKPLTVEDPTFVEHAKMPPGF